MLDLCLFEHFNRINRRAVSRWSQRRHAVEKSKFHTARLEREIEGRDHNITHAAAHGPEKMAAIVERQLERAPHSGASSDRSLVRITIFVTEDIIINRPDRRPINQCLGALIGVVVTLEVAGDCDGVPIEPAT